MTNPRMADTEITQRLESLHGEVRAAMFDIRGDLRRIEDRQVVTNGRVSQHDIVLAEVRGGLRVVIWMVGIGLAIPGTAGAIVGILVVAGFIGR
jgi:hypothetical protein